ncbi:SGNH/GDSL hydrolase family protein [Citrobacter freundii]|nr:SGNH/GDSL hydrolase family protein [Citrobacter freundii]
MAITRRILLKMAAPLALLTSAYGVHAAETASGNGGEHQKRKKTTSYAKEKIFSEVHITDFGGGVGKPPPINGDALSKAKIAASGGRIIFPTPGVYDFPLNTDLTGFIMSPVNGVVIRGPASAYMTHSLIVTDNDFKVYFDGGDPRDYFVDIRKNFHIGSKGANKSLWLNDGDVIDCRATPVNADSILIKQFLIGISDDLTTVLPARRSESSLYLTPPAGGNCHIGIVPMMPGLEIKAAVNNIPNNGGEIATGILFSTGYAILRGDPNSGDWLLTVKYKDKPSVDRKIYPDGGGTATYSASNNIMTVRCVSPVRGQILINGVVAVDLKITSGTIQYAGMGAVSNTLVSSSNFTGWYTNKFKIAKSPHSFSIGMIGDSITDGAVHGAWPAWCAEALDGSLGIRINGIENRAISGQTLIKQTENLAGNPFVDADVVVIFIGTNDIQGGNDLGSFSLTMNKVISDLLLQDRKIVLVIPPLWYLKDDRKHLAYALTNNSNKGGDFRAEIGRIAADNGLQLVDMTCVTGPVNPDYVSSDFADSMLRDNLHPTAYAYRIFGYEIAKAIAAEVCPVVEIPSEWIPINSFPPGVTGSLKFRYVNGGVELSGEINCDKPFNGVVASLPSHILPSSIKRYVQWGDRELIRTEIGPDGNVKVANYSSTVISMDNIFI